MELVLPLITLVLGSGLTLATQLVTHRAHRTAKREELEEARDDLHRKELAQAYVDLITRFHKYIDDGFALVMVVKEHNEVRTRTEAAIATAKMQAIYGTVPDPNVMSACLEVEKRAKRIKGDFFAGKTALLGKATVVQFLDDDTRRGLRVVELAKEPVPALETLEDAESFTEHLREQRRQFDAIAASLGGTFTPRAWAVRALEAASEPAQVPSTRSNPQLTAGQ